MLQVEAHPIVVATDFRALSTFIDHQVADGRRVRPGSVSEALLSRYRRQPPAVRDGVAIPHAAVRQLPRNRLVYTAHEPPIVLGPATDQVLRESMTLLVRYPPTAADHGLLQQLEQTRTQALMLAMFRAGDTAAVLSLLASMSPSEGTSYAGAALSSPT